MESDSGNTTQNSEPPVIPPIQSTGTGKKPSKQTKIVLGIVTGVVVLAGILLAVLMMNSKGDKSTKSGVDSTVYYSREGYGSLSDGIGDPAALAAETTANVVSYGGAPTLQPCTLLPIGDMSSLGLKLLPNQLTGPVKQAAFDGQSMAQLDTSSKTSLPSEPAGSFCQYFFTDDQKVTITTYQPSFVNPAAIDYEISRTFTPGSDVEGVKMYTSNRQSRTRGNETTYMLRDGNNALELQVDAKDDTKQKILNHVAKKLAAAKNSPTGTQKYRFDSPVFPVSSVTSCDSLSATDFRSVVGVDASPIVTEAFGSAVGVVSLGNKDHNFVSYECTRRSNDRYGDSTLRAIFTTYETADAAKQALAIERTAQPFTKNLQEITPSLGDESFYADVADLNKAIVLRKGRVVVKTTVGMGSTDTLTPEKRIQMLTPWLQNMVTGALESY